MITRRNVLAGGAALAGSLGLPQLSFAGANKLRVAQLKFGSVSWLMQTVVDQGLAKAANVDLELVNVATNSAGQIGLLSRDFDLIVSDWPWAMRQRSVGQAMKFAPYSSALGALMTAGDSPVKSLEDLVGKRIGVAGSALDKSWILLRAYGLKTINKDLAKVSQPLFGAPPLIQEQLRSGRIDAALNFWTFSAKLKGSGFNQILSMADVLAELGVSPVPPLIGFVWDQKTTKGKDEAIAGFFKSIKQANALLASDDAVWQNVRPKMRAKTDGEFEALKAYYRAGIPDGWSKEQTQSAENLLKLLIELGDRKLAGSKTKFDADLFYGI
ncbi:MAG: ABC transporter substrate-binding protein [Hyphomicrobiaceae bacterium]